MLGHQKYIIKEFISTALISEDPQEVLERGFEEAWDCIASDEDKLHLVDFLFESEKNIPLEDFTK